MKKLMSTMLALALVVGTATVTFAQADNKDKATTKKAKAAKKKADAKADAKDAPKKGKAKKAKDADKK